MHSSKWEPLGEHTETPFDMTTLFQLISELQESVRADELRLRLRRQEIATLQETIKETQYRRHQVESSIEAITKQLQLNNEQNRQSMSHSAREESPAFVVSYLNSLLDQSLLDDKKYLEELEALVVSPPPFPLTILNDAAAPATTPAFTSPADSLPRTDCQVTNFDELFLSQIQQIHRLVGVELPSLRFAVQQAEATQAARLEERQKLQQQYRPRIAPPAESTVILSRDPNNVTNQSAGMGYTHNPVVKPTRKPSDAVTAASAFFDKLRFGSSATGSGGLKPAAASRSTNRFPIGNAVEAAADSGAPTNGKLLGQQQASNVKPKRTLLYQTEGSTDSAAHPSTQQGGAPS
jgi:hypothetical protein